MLCEVGADDLPDQARPVLGRHVSHQEEVHHTDGEADGLTGLPPGTEDGRVVLQRRSVDVGEV